MCGARSFQIVEVIGGIENSQSIVTYQVVSPGVSHKLIITTQNESNDVGMHSMILRVTLPDPTYPTLDVAFNVDIQAPTCDCSLLTWDAPAPQAFSTTVLKVPSDEFTILMYTANEASKAGSPKIRACYPNTPCLETTLVTDVVATGSVLPAIFAWTMNDNRITVNADGNFWAQSYNMQITHSTIDGGDKVYNTVDITIAVCEYTHITTPTVPSPALTYTIFDTAQVVDFTPAFTAVPACGDAVNFAYTWTIPAGAPVTVTPANDYQFTIESTSAVDHNSYTLEFRAIGLWLNFLDEKYITFTITVTDPCRTATITAPTINTAMTVTLGQSSSQDFNEAVDTAGTLYGAAVCGTRVYVIKDLTTGLVKDSALI